MKCKCWTEINEKLKEKNLIMTGATFTMPGFKLVPIIQTEWIDKLAAPKGKRLRPPSMFASHCPFCGVELETDKSQKEIKK